MSESAARAGIYVKKGSGLAYRAPFGLLAPRGDDWVLLDEDPMIGLARVRELAAQRGIVSEPASIRWTGTPDQAVESA